jgi:hypothetical protein
VLGSCGGDKKVSAISVPEPVLASFARTYPFATDVDWKIEDGMYRAKFDNVKDDDMKAFFSANGTLVRTSFCGYLKLFLSQISPCFAVV